MAPPPPPPAISSSVAACSSRIPVELGAPVDLTADVDDWAEMSEISERPLCGPSSSTEPPEASAPVVAADRELLEAAVRRGALPHAILDNGGAEAFLDDPQMLNLRLRRESHGLRPLYDLGKYLNHSDREVRQRALGLVEARPGAEHISSIVAELDAFLDEKLMLQEQSAEGESCGEAQWAQNLASSDPRTRSCALKALMRQPGRLQPQHSRAVAELLRDEDPAQSFVRALAIEALGLLTPSELAEFAPAIAARLDDPAWQVRRVAADVLAQLEPADLSQYAEALATRLGDTKWQVRRNAVEALQRLEPAELERYEPAIVAMQADDDEQVNDAAAGVMEQLYAPGGHAEEALRAHFEGLQAELGEYDEPSVESGEALMIVRERSRGAS